jgi:hypothetical protein
MSAVSGPSKSNRRDNVVKLQLIPPVHTLNSTESYYDDYIRKKGASRTLADPPSLLTDRGAYVNFLEVQLEVCVSV